MADGRVRHLKEAKPPARSPLDLPARDVRAPRPFLLGALLRLEVARRLARLITLASLDFLGLLLGIWTALEFKAGGARRPRTSASTSTRRWTWRRWRSW